MKNIKKAIMWFRRDLRITDNTALYKALKNSEQVYCVFIYDYEILKKLKEIKIYEDKRVEFIMNSIAELSNILKIIGSELITIHGIASIEIPKIAKKLKADAVFCNHDYEPSAIARDKKVIKELKTEQRKWFSFKDHVIFEKEEILTKEEKIFTIFTRYKTEWMKKIISDKKNDNKQLNEHYITPYLKKLARINNNYKTQKITLDTIGFKKTNLHELLPIKPGMSGGQETFIKFIPHITSYDITRNFPSIDNGTSRLSVHLRFGTISIRALVNLALEIFINQKSQSAYEWLSELIWRDFYFMILYNYPYVIEHAFYKIYDLIKWNDGLEAKNNFIAWCNGNTGYPIIDAAMFQLNSTGYMHNRLRMITACFLVKNLGINWRWGEQYFANKLNDFELASNNGGWQWVASSGCSAQPYFRIFNPILQSQKFDAEGKFIRKYLPQLRKLPNKHIHTPWLCSSSDLKRFNIELGTNYPCPIVDYKLTKKKALKMYEIAIKTKI